MELKNATQFVLHIDNEENIGTPGPYMQMMFVCKGWVWALWKKGGDVKWKGRLGLAET